MIVDFSAIVCTAHTLGGSPRIDGRRLAVGDVVSSLSYGSVTEVVQKDELSYEQVRQALQYCATQQCLVDKPIVFCHNCSLRSRQEGPLDTSELEEFQSQNGTRVQGGGLLFFGTMKELLAEWQGQSWWLIASDLLIELRNDLSPEISPL